MNLSLVYTVDCHSLRDHKRQTHNETLGVATMTIPPNCIAPLAFLAWQSVAEGE